MVGKPELQSQLSYQYHLFNLSLLSLPWGYGDLNPLCSLLPSCCILAVKTNTLTSPRFFRRVTLHLSFANPSAREEGGTAAALTRVALGCQGTAPIAAEKLPRLPVNTPAL